MNYSEQLDYTHSLAGEYIASFSYPWQALQGLNDYLSRLTRSLGDEYVQIAEGVFVHVTAQITLSAYILSPCIIGANAQIRHGAFLRGGVLVGDGCVVGNSVELKNCVLFDGAQIPHFNYVGDSFIGHCAHMGAGAVTSNVRLDKRNIRANGLDTGLRKFGAIVGDYAEIGCNAVLNPGTVVGRGAKVYPLTSVCGVVEENAIVKNK